MGLEQQNRDLRERVEELEKQLSRNKADARRSNSYEHHALSFDAQAIRNTCTALHKSQALDDQPQEEDAVHPDRNTNSTMNLPTDPHITLHGTRYPPNCKCQTNSKCATRPSIPTYPSSTGNVQGRLLAAQASPTSPPTLEHKYMSSDLQAVHQWISTTASQIEPPNSHDPGRGLPAWSTLVGKSNREVREAKRPSS